MSSDALPFEFVVVVVIVDCGGVVTPIVDVDVDGGRRGGCCCCCCCCCCCDVWFLFVLGGVEDSSIHHTHGLEKYMGSASKISVAQDGCVVFILVLCVYIYVCSCIMFFLMLLRHSLFLFVCLFSLV